VDVRPRGPAFECARMARRLPTGKVRRKAQRVESSHALGVAEIWAMRSNV